MEVVGAGGVVVGVERAITVLKRSNPVVATAAMQGNGGVRTHRVSIEEHLLAIRIRVTVISLEGENLQVTFNSILAACPANGAYGYGMHGVMVVGVSGVACGEVMIEGRELTLAKYRLKYFLDHRWD